MLIAVAVVVAVVVRVVVVTVALVLAVVGVGVVGAVLALVDVFEGVAVVVRGAEGGEAQHGQ